MSSRDSFRSRCRHVVGILQKVKSRSLRQWRQLDIRITEAANESKDNVKFLSTLKKFFGPLGQETPNGEKARDLFVTHSTVTYYTTQ